MRTVLYRRFGIIDEFLICTTQQNKIITCISSSICGNFYSLIWWGMRYVQCSRILSFSIIYIFDTNAKYHIYHSIDLFIRKRTYVVVFFNFVHGNIKWAWTFHLYFTNVFRNNFNKKNASFTSHQMVWEQSLRKLLLSKIWNGLVFETQNNADVFFFFGIAFIVGSWLFDSKSDLKCT